MSSADLIAEQLSKQSGAPIQGVYQSLDGALARVIVSDGVVSVPIIGAYQPIPGQRVWLARFGPNTYLLGPADNGPAVAEVIDATDAPMILVEAPPGSDNNILMGSPTGMTLAPGDFVVIDRNVPIITAGPYAAASLPENAAPDDPDGETSGPQSRTFKAIDSGSYSSSWWTNDVYDSNSYDSAAFYGTEIRDTLPDTATITACAIYLSLKSSSGADPVLRLVSESTKPGGAPTFTGPSFALPFRSGFVSIPVTFLEAMRTTAYGIGFEANTGGYNVFNGTQSDGQAFSIIVNYTT